MTFIFITDIVPQEVWKDQVIVKYKVKKVYEWNPSPTEVGGNFAIFFNGARILRRIFPNLAMTLQTHGIV